MMGLGRVLCEMLCKGPVCLRLKPFKTAYPGVSPTLPFLVHNEAEWRFSFIITSLWNTEGDSSQPGYKSISLTTISQEPIESQTPSGKQGGSGHCTDCWSWRAPVAGWMEALHLTQFQNTWIATCSFLTLVKVTFDKLTTQFLQYLLFCICLKRHIRERFS